MKRRGINAENLTKLDLLNRKFQSPFSVEEAGEVLEMPSLPVIAGSVCGSGLADPVEEGCLQDRSHGGD